MVLQSVHLYRGTRRYYRAYTYTEVPVGTIEQNDEHYFTLIWYLEPYHINV